MKRVSLRVDYGLVGHGLAPLFIDGLPTELGFWGFSADLLRRLARLSELYDRQVNWDDPRDRTWRISDRDRTEFNALLSFVAAEIQMAIGEHWELVIESEPI
ncbi:MAG: hypothetical protein IPK28_10880 [Devosia sp.]|nr:hypothetical protein [Devosia sp.]